MLPGSTGFFISHIPHRKLSGTSGIPHQRSHFNSECFEPGYCLFLPCIYKSNTERYGRKPGKVPGKRLFEPVRFPHQSFNPVPYHSGRNITFAHREKDGIVSPEKGCFRHLCSINYRKDISPDTFPCLEKACRQVFGTQYFIFTQGMEMHFVQYLKTSIVSPTSPAKAF
jgi:hypothetical protein